jgi:hypothetical protein
MMKILQEVLAELFSMFWADARMTTTVLTLVLAVAALLKFTSINSITIGGLLLLGCLAIVIEAAIRETRKRRQR